MVDFTCWKCRHPMSAADGEVGRAAACGSCGATCTVPDLRTAASPAATDTPATPQHSDDAPAQTDVAGAAAAPPPGRNGRTLLVVGLIALLVVACAWWWLTRPTPLGPALKYLPDDCFKIEARRP